MKGIAIVCAIGLTALVEMLAAQQRLEPEVGQLAEGNEYEDKIRQVFTDALKGQTVLRVVIVPSFQPEQVIGIRSSPDRFEAFVVTPSSSIWQTHYTSILEYSVRMAKENNDEASVSGLLEQIEEAKKEHPYDVREIKTTTATRVISDKLVKRVMSIWERMILQARPPKYLPVRTDGVSYHFSMWVRGRGNISAKTWSPDRDTRAEYLSIVAEALKAFVDETVEESEISRWVSKLEK